MAKFSLLSAAAAVAVLALSADAKLKGKECEVCIKVVNNVVAAMKADGKDLSKHKETETAFRTYCEAAKINKESRFCYYIGGLETSATGGLQDLSKPMSRFLPTEKVCEKLKKKDAQICELIYDVPIDLKTIDLKKQRVKVLRKILNDQFNDPCTGCLEKSDYVKRIKLLAKDEL